MSFSITSGLCALTDVKSALQITDTRDDDRISLAIDSASRLIEEKCNRRFWQDPAPRTDAGCTLVNGSALVLDAAIQLTDAGRIVTDPLGYVPNDTGALGTPQSLVGNVVAGVSFQLVNFEGTALPATGGGVETLTIGLAPRQYVSSDPWLVQTDDFYANWGLTVQSDYAGDGTFGTTWAAADMQLEPVNGLWQGESWPTTQIRAVRSLYFPVWGGIAYPKPYTQALVRVTARWGWNAIPTMVQKAAIVQAISIFRSDDVPFGATPFAESGIVRLKTALHPTAELLIERYSENSVFVA